MLVRMDREINERPPLPHSSGLMPDPSACTNLSANTTPSYCFRAVEATRRDPTRIFHRSKKDETQWKLISWS
jgi:hypothetical protein